MLISQGSLNVITREPILIFRLIRVWEWRTSWTLCQKDNKVIWYKWLIFCKRSKNIKTWIWKYLTSGTITLKIYAWQTANKIQPTTKVKGTLSGLRQVLATESPLKWWKILFISPKKLFPFSRYWSFCVDFLVMWQNGLKSKTKLISNFITSQPG